MKQVSAVIKTFKLDDVREALAKLEIHTITATEIKSFGGQRGRTEKYRGAKYAVDFLPQIKIEIVVDDELVDQVVEAIKGGANAGIGSGKIFVFDVSQVVRIRTGEIGPDAL